MSACRARSGARWSSDCTRARRSRRDTLRCRSSSTQSCRTSPQPTTPSSRPPSTSAPKPSSVRVNEPASSPPTSTWWCRRPSPGSPCRRSRPGSPTGSACDPTYAGCRCSDSAVWPGLPGWRGCTICWSVTPDQVGVLLSVELCSLTLQRDDPSMANLVASGLFGDGGCGRGRGRLRAPRARPDHRRHPSRTCTPTPSERWAGTSVRPASRSSSGRRCPTSSRCTWPTTSRRLLAAHDLDLTDVGVWVAHPGGPKVLTAVQDALGLPAAHFAQDLAVAGRGRQPVVGVGAARTRCHRWPPTPAPGTYGLLFAMGPGFCAELVLLAVVTPMTWYVVLLALVGRRAAGRAGGLQAQCCLEPRPRRPGVRVRPLPGDGRAAHRPARRLPGRADRGRPAVHPGAGLADAGARRRVAGVCAGGASRRSAGSGTPG